MIGKKSESVNNYSFKWQEDMEDNKYYTPEISEFHVGFEFEWRHKPKPIVEFNPDLVSALEFLNGLRPVEIRKQDYLESVKRQHEREAWKPGIADENFFDTDRDTSPLPSISEVFSNYADIEFRVPYLISEDIEAEGWKFIDEGEYKVDAYYSKKIDYKQSIIEFRIRYWDSNHNLGIWSEDTGCTYFDGTIKNKSEFRRILKMINV